MAMLATGISAAPSILEARVNERLAITLYKEAGTAKCRNPITDHPEFPSGKFLLGKADVNEKCYTNVSFNSFAIDYIQDPKRGCRGTYLFHFCDFDVKGSGREMMLMAISRGL